MSAAYERYRTAKRIFDISCALAGLAVTAPMQVAISIIVLIKHGRPVIFKQERPGLNGETFSLLKFRTMRPYDEQRGWITDEQRLTSFGRILRQSSLDELPSLINVLRGDMSLVGPRPLLVKYLDFYTPEQARRHEVRPGITGLAQVRGRNSITWEEKFAWDLEYVDRQSFLLDLRIILETINTVFRRTGVSAAGEATMPEFRGTTVPSRELFGKPLPDRPGSQDLTDEPPVADE